MLFMDRVGEGIDVATGRVRLRDSEMRRVRALQILSMYRAGQTVESIARYFRLSVRHVYREIASVPVWQRNRLNGEVG